MLPRFPVALDVKCITSCSALFFKFEANIVPMATGLKQSSYCYVAVIVIVFQKIGRLRAWKFLDSCKWVNWAIFIRVLLIHRGTDKPSRKNNWQTPYLSYICDNYISSQVSLLLLLINEYIFPPRKRKALDLDALIEKGYMYKARDRTNTTPLCLPLYLCVVAIVVY